MLTCYLCTQFVGLFTAVFAILCMILFLTRPGTQYYLIFGLPISRVYTSVSSFRHFVHIFLRELNDIVALDAHGYPHISRCSTVNARWF